MCAASSGSRPPGSRPQRRVGSRRRARPGSASSAPSVCAVSKQVTMHGFALNCDADLSQGRQHRRLRDRRRRGRLDQPRGGPPRHRSGRAPPRGEAPRTSSTSPEPLPRARPDASPGTARHQPPGPVLPLRLRQGHGPEDQWAASVEPRMRNRVLQLVLACGVLGVGVALLLDAVLGSDGYSSLVSGLTRNGPSFALVNVAVAVALIALAWGSGTRPGLGTLSSPWSSASSSACSCPSCPLPQGWACASSSSVPPSRC